MQPIFDQTSELPIAADLARVLNHDLGYDAHLRRQHNSSYDSKRLTKFDVLKLLG